MENEFPPNSHNRREARPARDAEDDSSNKRQVRQVTTGKVRLRKKSLFRKFLDAFRPEDNVGFVEYTLLEVLAPGIKDAISYTTHEVIDNALGTSGGHRRRRRDDRGGYTSYNRMSGSRRDRDDRDDRRERRSRGNSGDVPEVILDTRVECEEVLDNLIELASKYDYATRRDLLSMIGERHTTTDEDWGWADLRGARIHRIGRNGYLLDLPRPEYLD